MQCSSFDDRSGVETKSSNLKWLKVSRNEYSCVTDVQSLDFFGICFIEQSHGFKGVAKIHIRCLIVYGKQYAVTTQKRFL